MTPNKTVKKKIQVPPPACWAAFCLFLALKLFGAIHWSWWAVTAPLWLPVMIVVGFFLLVLAS